MAKIASKRAALNPLLVCLLISIALEILLELLSRRSFSSLFDYLTGSPLIAICNVAVIMLTLSVAFLFKRRAFIYTIVIAAWLALGVTNCYLLTYRSAPLNMSDFYIIRAAIGVASVYVSASQWILFGTGATAIIIAAILIWKKAPVSKTAAKTIMPVAFMLMVSIVIANNVSVNVNAADSYDELYDTYEDYGFAYCFAKSCLDTGMDEPENYDKNSVEQIVEKIDDADDADKLAGSETAVTPNVIFVQLESFFDAKRLEGVEYSENPTPVWDELRENYSSGFLTVPTVGAGTAKTEFEMLCSMSVEYFGLGECPYYTILQREPCESIATVFKSAGYKATALHNNIASFYSRNVVYPNLGFEDFISIEDMPESEFNLLGWSYDSTLFSHAESVIEADDTSNDFLFCVSVQAHGKYPDEPLDDYPIDAELSLDSEEDLTDLDNQLDYYASTLNSVDEAIGDFIDRLEEIGEPTIVVFYGDHLPSFDYNILSLNSGNYNQTEYVIWDNIGLEHEKADYCAYQLSSHILDLLGIEGDSLNGLHNNFSGDESYEKMLRVLEYDILYGENYSEK